MPIWKAWRVARIVSIYDRQSALIDSAGAVIELKNIALDKANKTIAAYDSAYMAKDNEAKECRSLVSVSNELHKTELKNERKKGRKEGAIGAGGIGLILLILAL